MPDNKKGAGWTKDERGFWVATVDCYLLTVYPAQLGFWAYTIRQIETRGLPKVVAASKYSIRGEIKARIMCMTKLRKLGIRVTQLQESNL